MSGPVSAGELLCYSGGSLFGSGAIWQVLFGRIAIWQTSSVLPSGNALLRMCVCECVEASMEVGVQ